MADDPRLYLAEPPYGVSLKAATLAHLAAEERGPEHLCQLLDCAEPTAWPPEHMDEDFRNWLRERLLSDSANCAWFNWYIAAPVDRRETLVGCAGFKGPPDENGVVEIGYSIVKCYQRRGFGTAAVNLLCRHAFADPRVNSVAAETLSSLAASISLLKKCGFCQLSEERCNEAGTVLRFILNRS